MAYTFATKALESSHVPEGISVKKRILKTSHVKTSFSLNRDQSSPKLKQIACYGSPPNCDTPKTHVVSEAATACLLRYAPVQ
jgi:hypothetical protein